MSVTARFLAFTLLLLCPTLPPVAAAETDDEAERLRQSAPKTLRYWEQEQRHGLQAARLSVAIASINVPKLAIWGSIWLPVARDQSDPALRRRLYAIGPIQLAGAAANVTWLFFAGQSLRDYKHDGRKWMTARRLQPIPSVSVSRLDFRSRRRAQPLEEPRARTSSPESANIAPTASETSNADIIGT